jgi:hypothetical protein
MVQNIVKYILYKNYLWNLNLCLTIAFGLLRALLIIGGVALLATVCYREIQSVLFYIGIAAIFLSRKTYCFLFLRDQLRVPNTLAVIITLIFLFSIICGAIL